MLGRKRSIHSWLVTERSRHTVTGSRRQKFPPRHLIAVSHSQDGRTAKRQNLLRSMMSWYHSVSPIRANEFLGKAAGGYPHVARATYEEQYCGVRNYAAFWPDSLLNRLIRETCIDRILSSHERTAPKNLSRSKREITYAMTAKM